MLNSKLAIFLDIKMIIKPLIQRFLKDTSGNFAIMFGLTALPVLLMVGGAIDIMRISKSNAKLQSAVDSGVLSAASLTNDRDPLSVATEYIQANLDNDVTFQNLNITLGDETDITLNNKVVEITATADIPLSFLGLVGLTKNTITATAEAVEARQSLEMSLVLDVSSSMNGNRISSLKGAATDFIDQMLPINNVNTTSINLVPFGGTVNLGGLFDDYVVDSGFLSDGTTPADPDVIIDPSESEYDIGSDIFEEKFRFTDSGACVEMHSDEFNLNSVLGKSKSQVPHFWKWVNFNPWCPEDESASIWNSNDAEKLKDRINEMSLSDGTGMDQGVLWGAKALSPAFQGLLGGDFPERPNDFNDPDNDIIKVMVLMSDGGMTAQFRPENPNVKQIKNWTQQTILHRGGKSHAAGTNRAMGNLKAICDDLHEQNVIVFTIGFQISKNSFAEYGLQYCASNPANYYLVESLDISKAFEAIAVAVQKLRVSS